jgi:hypothetical protein
VKFDFSSDNESISLFIRSLISMIITRRFSAGVGGAYFTSAVSSSSGSTIFVGNADAGEEEDGETDRDAAGDEGGSKDGAVENKAEGEPPAGREGRGGGRLMLFEVATGAGNEATFQIGSIVISISVGFCMLFKSSGTA